MRIFLKSECTHRSSNAYICLIMISEYCLICMWITAMMSIDRMHESLVKDVKEVNSSGYRIRTD